MKNDDFKKTIETLRASPKHKSNDKRLISIDQKWRDKEYLKNYYRATSGPDWKEKQLAGCAKVQNDPEYKAKMEAKSQRQFKPIQDPDGNIFSSRKAAAEYYGVCPQSISKWVKQGKGWKYI
jgi:predicted secreted protein